MDNVPTTIALVILNWNGLHYLKQFLPSVVQGSKVEGCRVDIFIADNGSTDGSLAWLAQNYPQVVAIDLEQNHGFAQGYNLALKQAEADLYMVLNSDVLVEEGWLEPLVRFMQSNPQAAACQPKILSFANPNRFEYAGASGGFIDRLGYPFCRGRILSVHEIDVGQYDDAIKIMWATGACMLVRSKLFWDAGAFDADFFAHMEEIDLCWRFHRLGHEVWCIPSSRVWHMGGGTLPNTNPFKLYLNYRNNLMMLHKNLVGRQRWALWFRILLDCLSALAYLFSARSKSFVAVFKAHRDFFRWFKRNRNRAKELPILPISKAPIYPGSIVVGYFLRRRNHFSKLKSFF